MANQTPTVQELQALIIALQGQVTALQNAALAAPAAPTAAVLFAETPQTLGVDDLIDYSTKRGKDIYNQGKIALSIIAENELPATVIEELEDGINLEIVEVPGGEFWLGSSEGEEGVYSDERPQHKVKISPFLMGKYPITQAQWRAVASLPKVERDLNPEPSYYKGYSRRPVECISWYEAVEFCERLSRWSEEKGKGYQYRLPSEAEWEYACRSVISYQLSVISEESIQNPIYLPYHFGLGGHF